MIDTHAHLDHLPHLDQALVNAREAGVTGIVAVSMDVESCQKNLEIKQKTTDLFIALAMGIHPEKANLKDLSVCQELIRAHASQLSAIGEIGLDFWYKWVRKDKEKHAEQREVFRSLLQLAKDMNLPAVIHSRGTWRECFETTKDIGLEKAVFHWYSGPVDVLKDIVDAGYFVSCTPALAYSPQSREAIAHAPIQQILIETDCPVYFQGNETEQGFQAEPKDVWRTLKAYCALKAMDEDEALKILNQNAKQFFNLKG